MALLMTQVGVKSSLNEKYSSIEVNLNMLLCNSLRDFKMNMKLQFIFLFI